MLIILFLFCFSCQNEKTEIELIDPTNLTQNEIDSILEKFNFQYETPIIIDSSSEILIPISTELIDKRRKHSSSGYEYYDFPRFWNVLFYNHSTKEKRLLTNEKFRISEIITDVDNDKPRDLSKTFKNKILFTISNIDYNQDDKINRSDPESLFISEINGQNLTRISPEKEDIIYHKIIPNTEKILIETRRDINRDSIFNSEDELIWYIAEHKSETWQIEEVIDSLMREEIKKMYFDQWLIKK